MTLKTVPEKMAAAMCLTIVVLATISFIGLQLDDGSIDSPSAPGQTSVPTPATIEVDATPTATTAPTATSHITIIKDGQDRSVTCKSLQVLGNNNLIRVENSDIERIQVLGSGNVVAYPRDADPTIQDHGNYNDVYQRWL